MFASKREQIAELIKSALAELVDTPDGVAATLISLGIKGVRGVCGLCPIAEYLRKKIPQATEVEARCYGCEVVVDGVSGFARNPSRVSAFMFAFDRKDYPSMCLGEPAAA